ncbi:NAD(P)-binding protein [Durotheca rogersii]|uniref:NAD(P)-binding protein n=1 Tax=Durotheca rogersii TaxID=419775 RepID=UPI00221E43DB|nr:NAD(P)-binding protein [Durotheca rogersii]KAI5860392.1 NAD(P)-binding protein [Durotheca rogersii]
MAPAKGTILATAANGSLSSSVVKHKPALAQDYHGLYAVRGAESATTAKKAFQGAKAAKHGSRYIGHDFAEDNFNMTFQAAYLSRFLLALLLLQGMDEGNGGIAHLRSAQQAAGQRPRGRATPLNLQQPEQRISKGIWDAAAGLTRRLPADPSLSRAAALAVDPAAMIGSLARRSGEPQRVLALRVPGPLLAPLASQLFSHDGLRTPSKSAGDVERARFEDAAYLNESPVAGVGAEAEDETKYRRLQRDIARGTSTHYRGTHPVMLYDRQRITPRGVSNLGSVTLSGAGMAGAHIHDDVRVFEMASFG